MKKGHVYAHDELPVLFVCTWEERTRLRLHGTRRKKNVPCCKSQGLSHVTLSFFCQEGEERSSSSQRNGGARQGGKFGVCFSNPDPSLLPLSLKEGGRGGGKKGALFFSHARRGGGEEREVNGPRKTTTGWFPSSPPLPERERRGEKKGHASYTSRILLFVRREGADGRGGEVGLV